MKFKSLEECLAVCEWDMFGSEKVSRTVEDSVDFEFNAGENVSYLENYSLSDIANNKSFAEGLARIFNAGNNSSVKVDRDNKTLKFNANQIRKVMLEYTADWKNATCDGLLMVINDWLED